MKLLIFNLLIVIVLLMSHYGISGSFRAARARLTAPFTLPSKRPKPH